MELYNYAHSEAGALFFYGFVLGVLLVGFAVALVLLRREERGDGDKRRAEDEDYSTNGQGDFG